MNEVMYDSVVLNMNTEKTHIKGKYDMDLPPYCISFSVSNRLTLTLCL